MNNLLRSLSYARPYKYLIFFILGLTVLVALAGVAEPLAIKFIFDNLGSNAPALKKVGTGALMLVALAVLKESFTALSNYFSWKTRIRIHYGLLNDTVERIHSLPLDHHKKEGVGATMTKLERSIQSFISAISEIVFNTIPAVLWLIMAMIVMFQLDWKMALLVLIFGPIPGLIAAKAAPTQSERERFLMGRWGKIYSRFHEVLSGIVTVRSFAMEDYEIQRFLKDVDSANNTVVKGIGYDSTVGAFQNMAVTLARVSAIGLGAYFVIMGEITLGTLMAFMGYVAGFFGPVQGLTNIYKTWNTAKASLEYIFGILDHHSSLGDSKDAIELTKVKGNIRFINVKFSYPNSGNQLLKGIDLSVKKGESIAIVGPSGSGKSTLMALLQRFYDPVEGSIFLDGTNIKNLRQQSLRKQIGVVLQDALLFNDTVKNNISYGRPDATDKEITEAAIAANAHDFILNLDDQYDTILGERGGRLSVGERQRIAIARALLKNPPILILDEATSALDAELEAKVQEALERLMKGRTTFIIAHRLSTVVNADRILVFKNGRIIESGNHKVLIGGNGYYKQLVETQTKGLLPN